MKPIAQADKILLFNRLLFTAFFGAGLLLSGVPFLERLVDVAPQYLFPVKLLIYPLLFAALVEFVPFFRRATQTISKPTLWFNAIYIVAIGLTVLVGIQLAALLFGGRSLTSVNFVAMVKSNFVLLMWAVFAVFLFRLVLGRMFDVLAGSAPTRGIEK